MSLKTAVRDTLVGFKSLLTGMRITAREAAKPIITVQYPHETLPMPERFRGHVQLILDPETGKSRCTACGLCVRACPSDCLEVDGLKKEGEKKKSVSLYKLDFTTCSLCGSCVEACPSDAIEYSKAYNVVSRNRDDFARMDLMQDLQQRSQAWAEKNPEKAAAAAEAAAAAAAEAAKAAAAKPAPAAKPAAATPAPAAAPASPPAAPAPAATTNPTPSSSSTNAGAPVSAAAGAATQPQESKTT